MTNTAVSTGSEAMPKIDRKEVMTQAWAIFRRTYKYPQIKFSDIGRKCFAWALRRAWIEAREVARLAAMTSAAKSSRIETLQALIVSAGFIDSGPEWKGTVTRVRDEIRQLQAA